MKRLLLAVAMLCSLATIAQNKTYKYDFFYNLAEKGGVGPALISQCPGTYNWQMLPAGVGHVGYNFNKGCGLLFNDSTTNFLASGSYTIEMYFKLDTITGYKKLIDLTNMGADKGLYNFNGKLALYPKLTSPDSIIGPDKYVYVAITRNVTSKKMYIYINNDTAATFMDNAVEYVYGVNKRVAFFKDDAVTSGEHAGGSIAMIAISNYDMDMATVKSNYAQLASTLGVTGMQQPGNEIAVSPNPATAELKIHTPANGECTVYSITGNIIARNCLKHGSNVVDIRSFSPGMYFVKVSTVGSLEKTFKVLVQ